MKGFSILEACLQFKNQGMFMWHQSWVFIKIFLVSVNLLLSLRNTAQKKWDGGGGDGQWSTAMNWFDDVVPVVTDDILLDNSLITGSYIVQLPIIAVTINRLTINPTLPASIQVLLPVSNTVIPAFTVTGTGGIIINNGGLFINSSGGSPGTAIVIADSIHINNGGRFVHRSGNGHASYIAKLSRAPGTENGTFEFDVPGPSSYTVSLAGRTYGNLKLLSDAAGGTKSYLSNGSTSAIIRGECRINAGVNYSLDFTGDLSILGQLVNYGNFNLASGPNSNVVKVRQDFYCFGTITETAAGQPVIELNGSNNQNLSIIGTVNNSVTLKINNTAGVSLVSSVSLPHKLELANGKVITTSLFLLTLQAGCSIQTDSTNSNNFINGPLRKLGLNNTAHFIFPVGKAITQRWVALKNATGDFTVEFFRNSAHSIGTSLGTGIDHVSLMEYWSIDAASSATGKAELSFNNVNSGGVTDLATLRVAQFSAGTWTNVGNTMTTGSAGAAGSVISTVLVFGPTVKYFTLASSVSNQNPLPVEWVNFNVRTSADELHFTWQTKPGIIPDYFDIEYSDDGNRFFVLKKITSMVVNGSYQYSIKKPSLFIRYYRLKTVYQQTVQYYSTIVPVNFRNGNLRIHFVSPAVSSSHITVSVNADKSCQIIFYFINYLGQVSGKIPYQLYPGNQFISLPVYRLGSGYYQVFGLSSTLHTNPLIFIKP